MGITKTESFSDLQNRLADYFKVLGHPARIAILEHLVNANSCICGDLVDVLPLSQATVSQHLKELKQAGLIKGEISGTSVCYCINAEKWQEVKSFLNEFMDRYPNLEDSCC